MRTGSSVAHMPKESVTPAPLSWLFWKLPWFGHPIVGRVATADGDSVDIAELRVTIAFRRVLHGSSGLTGAHSCPKLTHRMFGTVLGCFMCLDNPYRCPSLFFQVQNLGGFGGF